MAIQEMSMSAHDDEYETVLIQWEDGSSTEVEFKGKDKQLIIAYLESIIDSVSRKRDIN